MSGRLVAVVVMSLVELGSSSIVKTVSSTLLMNGIDIQLKVEFGLMKIPR